MRVIYLIFCCKHRTYTKNITYKIRKLHILPNNRLLIVAYMFSLINIKSLCDVLEDPRVLKIINLLGAGAAVRTSMSVCPLSCFHLMNEGKRLISIYTYGHRR